MYKINFRASKASKAGQMQFESPKLSKKNTMSLKKYELLILKRIV